MKPAIFHPPGKPGEAVLIDLHSVVYTRDVQGHALPPGKAASIALRGVAMKHLRAGEFAPIDGEIYPMPCQVAALTGWQEKQLLWRGIYPDAARALLSMPLGFECRVSPGEDFRMGKDSAGFNKWNFATAWGWSLWQELHRQSGNRDWPLERRWQELKAIGFTGGFPAFRQICSRLKLSVTESGPNL